MVTKRVLILCPILALGLALQASGRPAQVILLRHAEKPDDDSNPHLSSRGERRAVALVDFLTTNRALTNAATPAFLIATRPSHDRTSRRPIETLEPLADRLHLRVETPYRANDWKALAAMLLDDPRYDGKNVVICWVHDSISELGQALGAGDGASRWDGDVYDRVWLIRFDADGSHLKVVKQELLPGDKGYKRHGDKHRGRDIGAVDTSVKPDPEK